MQALNVDLSNGLNLYEGRAGRRCCNANAK